MASVDTYTKSGTKAATAATLPKQVFDVEVGNHQLLKEAYVAYLANGRQNLATVKTRGMVRGGGKKPWRQKGTGRARVGSSRTPIWRGGGAVFGPTGGENYKHYISAAVRKQALSQALTLAAQSGKIKVIETFECKEGKAAPTVKLLQKIGADSSTLLVVSLKDDLVKRATQNVADVKAVQAMYVNVFDVMNADHVVISKKALEIVTEWLDPQAKTPKAKEAAK